MFTRAAIVLLAIVLASADPESSRAYHPAAPSAQTNYIITSKPFTVRDEANAGTIKWRRDTITGASLIGASDPAKMKYSIECTDHDECAGIELGGSDATFKPYTQDELNRILKRYGEAADNEAESSDKVLSYDNDSGNNRDKPKASWNLVDSQQQQQQSPSNNNPYDDRRGWVTLEPMAWSSSHIQKWEPNNRPTWPPPPQDHQSPSYSPWASNRPIQRPGGGGNNYHQPQQQHQHHQQSDWTTERPWIRPTYDYSAKPSQGSSSHYQQKPSPPPPQQSSQSFYGWNNAEQDIITDGKPGQFPADAYHKPWTGDYGQTPSYGPRPTEAEGDGHWVLLSSTKGYSIPHRPNRSLQSRSVSIDAVSRPVETVAGRSEDPAMARSAADPVVNRPSAMPSSSSSSKRTVRLMVLPPENDSPNVTTSHNGMIQVDASGKSVDQEQREFAARALKQSENDVQVFADRSAKANADDRRAVLAAVGAGMLPAATMAMFLPMVVNRKRRHAAGPEVILRHHVFPR